MDKIIAVIGGVPESKSRNDDDFSDRLSYRYTTGLLIVFAIIVSTKQYVGEPINCWVPAHFSGAWETYTDSYCWIKNTYYLPFEEYIPHEHEPEKRQMIPYYQWVPLIMLTQALLFYLPCMFWRSLNSRSGVDVNNIVESGETFQNIELADAKEKTMEYMTVQMDRYLKSQKKFGTGTMSIKHCIAAACGCCGRHRGNYLVSLYIITKIIYIANVLGQLFLLNAFLGTDFHTYGLDVLAAIAQGVDWTESPRFPRVTMCDFNIRRLGNVQRYTVQCVLPINLFNEKIYLFLWFWMVLVATLSCITLLQWLLRSLLKTDRLRYIKKNLTLHDVFGSQQSLREKEEPDEQVQEFTEKYLKQDGVFILRLVDINTNAITASEFIVSLWNKWRAGPSGDDDSD